MPKAQLAALLKSVDECAKASGESVCRDMDAAARLLLLWVDDLLHSKLTGAADPLLHGVRAAVVEATASASLGLARSAAFSMRAEVDMLLSWVYFKDHPVEWRNVEEMGEGFMLKSDVLKYLGEYYRRFRDRLGMLRQVKRRKEDDPYRLLSAHVHSQSSPAVPKVSALIDVIAAKPRLAECAALQADVTEYLGDVLMSCYASEWASLPKDVVASVRARLTKEQQKVFFV